MNIKYTTSCPVCGARSQNLIDLEAEKPSGARAWPREMRIYTCGAYLLQTEYPASFRREPLRLTGFTRGKDCETNRIRNIVREELGRSESALMINKSIYPLNKEKDDK